MSADGPKYSIEQVNNVLKLAFRFMDVRTHWVFKASADAGLREAFIHRIIPKLTRSLSETSINDLDHIMASARAYPAFRSNDVTSHSMSSALLADEHDETLPSVAASSTYSTGESRKVGEYSELLAGDSIRVRIMPDIMRLKDIIFAFKEVFRGVKKQDADHLWAEMVRHVIQKCDLFAEAKRLNPKRSGSRVSAFQSKLMKLSSVFKMNGNDAVDFEVEQQEACREAFIKLIQDLSKHNQNEVASVIHNVFHLARLTQTQFHSSGMDVRLIALSGYGNAFLDGLGLRHQIYPISTVVDAREVADIMKKEATFLSKVLEAVMRSEYFDAPYQFSEASAEIEKAPPSVGHRSSSLGGLTRKFKNLRIGRDSSCVDEDEEDDLDATDGSSLYSHPSISCPEMLYCSSESSSALTPQFTASSHAALLLERAPTPPSVGGKKDRIDRSSLDGSPRAFTLDMKAIAEAAAAAVAAKSNSDEDSPKTPPTPGAPRERKKYQ